MRIVKGNLWDSKDSLILVTGNSYIRKDGTLVMGRGAALELKTMIPGIDKRLGQKILSSLNPKQYLFVIDDKIYYEHIRFGVFQVKYHFKNPADLELIGTSCFALRYFLQEYDIKVSMNFPGIGYGGLAVEEVLPIIYNLPDSVTIYMNDDKFYDVPIEFRMTEEQWKWDTIDEYMD